MPQAIDLTADPTAQLLRQRALADLRTLLTELRGVRALAVQSFDTIPCDGHVDWLGPASEAFRQRGAQIRALMQPAIDDLEAAILLIEQEAY